jgi:hypothetical protein
MQLPLDLLDDRARNVEPQARRDPANLLVGQVPLGLEQGSAQIESGLAGMDLRLGDAAQWRQSLIVVMWESRTLAFSLPSETDSLLAVHSRSAGIPPRVVCLRQECNRGEHRAGRVHEASGSASLHPRQKSEAPLPGWTSDQRAEPHRSKDGGWGPAAARMIRARTSALGYAWSIMSRRAWIISTWRCWM